MKNLLRSQNHGFYQPDRGKYGNLEYPIFVANITKEELINLAVSFTQQSIIYGDVVGYGLATYYYIETQNMDISALQPTDYKTASTRRVFHRKDTASDNYTEIKGRKFVIPFFDEEMKNAEFKDGYLLDNISGKKIFYNPESDKTEYLNETELEVLRRASFFLQEGKTGRCRWEGRGIIKAILHYNYFEDKYDKVKV